MSLHAREGQCAVTVGSKISTDNTITWCSYESHSYENHLILWRRVVETWLSISTGQWPLQSDNVWQLFFISNSINHCLLHFHVLLFNTHLSRKMIKWIHLKNITVPLCYRLAKMKWQCFHIFLSVNNDVTNAYVWVIIRLLWSVNLNWLRGMITNVLD